MIATLDPRKLALELAGKWRDEAAWTAARAEIRAKVREGLILFPILSKAGSGGPWRESFVWDYGEVHSTFPLILEPQFFDPCLRLIVRGACIFL